VRILRALPGENGISKWVAEHIVDRVCCFCQNGQGIRTIFPVMRPVLLSAWAFSASAIGSHELERDVVVPDSHVHQTTRKLA